MPVFNPVALKPEDLVILPGGHIGIVIEYDDINPGVYYRVLINGIIECVHRDDMIIFDEDFEGGINEFS